MRGRGANGSWCRSSCSSPSSASRASPARSTHPLPPPFPGPPSPRGPPGAPAPLAAPPGAGAALLRALALPRLLGPAILAGIFYLWSAYRAAPGAERRSAGWLWEYLVLALALAGVVAWNLLVR